VVVAERIEMAGVVPPVLTIGLIAVTLVTEPVAVALMVTAPVPAPPVEEIVIPVPAMIDVTPPPPPPPVAVKMPFVDTLRPLPITRGPRGPFR
jgi:hypothetical protein